MVMGGKNRFRTIIKSIRFLLVVFGLWCLLAAPDLRAQQQAPQKPKTGVLHPKKKDTAHAALKPQKAVTTPKTTTGKTLPQTAVKPTVPAKPHPAATAAPKKPASIAAAKNSITAIKDTTALKTSTLLPGALGATKIVRPMVQRKNDTLFRRILSVPYLPVNRPPVYMVDVPHSYQGKDALFYAICGLFFLYGLIRSGFSKYFDGLFYNFIYPTQQLKKDRENTGQNNFPSLALNILFCLSAGLLFSMAILETSVTKWTLWELWMYSSLLLASVYLIKYITISIAGWVFNASEDTSIYTYIVFQINKILGIVFLPFLLILAFGDNSRLSDSMIHLAGLLVIALLVYRYLISFALLSKNLKMNAFHFFIYLCAVEVVPILVLYKLFSRDLSRLL